MIETDLSTPLLSAPSRESVYRRNFVYFLIDNLLFTVAFNVVGSTTVIPDFARQLTSSEVIIGVLGSLFTVGSTLPQLFVARYIVRHARKKAWFVIPNIPIRFVILLFAALTVWFGKDQPQLILIALFICYGIAAVGDGVVSVPWVDMCGTSLDQRWRARMSGLTTALTGIIMLFIAPLIGVVLGEGGPPFPNNYALLFAASGLLFVVSILPGLFFHELPGGKPLQKLPSLGEFVPDLGRVLRDDRPFRAFIITRMLTSLFMMAAPFYIGYATVELRLSSEVAVPVLVMMQTLGLVGGSLLYTWLGARDNLLYMKLSLGGATLLPICALLAGIFGPLPLYVGFLLSGLTTSNLLSSYMNWVLGYASAEQRPIYSGLANSITALFSLLAPIIGGTIAQYFGYRPLFVVSLVLALSALFVTVRFLRVTRLTAPVVKAAV